jgi:hypothetical protein
LDLRTLDSTEYLPADPRDPAQTEAAHRAWESLLAARPPQAALLLCLPRGPQRLPLLLAASQALHARQPGITLYLAYDEGMQGLWDETAWGALEGGALLPEDLGPDPAQWERRLTRAQELLPGRPWTLWLPQDPGALLPVLLGDGGRLVVPAGGAAAALAAGLPAGFSGVEGGVGDLTLRRSGTGELRRWRFEGGAWVPSELRKERNEVSVTAAAAYDVGALMARMRATQLRDRSALRQCEARLDVDLHMDGLDLGYTFQAFERNGEGEERLQKEIRLDGVKMLLRGGERLPQMEARASLAAPVALAVSERFRYEDAGPGRSAGTRRLAFEPVDGDSRMPRGELLVEEATGRVLEERSRRSELPGLVKSEERILTYGEPSPGYWRVVRSVTFERWMTASGLDQVQRRLDYRDFRINGADFEARRDEARASDGTMFKQTLDGLRYYTTKDGRRQVEEHEQNSGRLLGILLYNGFVPLPVFQYFNFNAFNRGVQFSWTCGALVLNQVSAAVPGLPGGFDASASLGTLLIPTTLKPVKGGRELNQDAVDRLGGDATVTLARDLGMGFRAEAQSLLTYDHYRQAGHDATPGYTLPPSGLTREWRGLLSWQNKGFQMSGYWGSGQRPDGAYGTPSAPLEVPDQGRFHRWGGSLGYEHRFDANWWLGGKLGMASGNSFDRFNNLGVGVEGIRPYLTTDRLTTEQVSLTFPPTATFRLKLTLQHGDARSLDDRRTYGFTGLNATGTLPGFWVFNSTQVNLSGGLQSDVPGLREVSGIIQLLKIF